MPCSAGRTRCSSSFRRHACSSRVDAPFWRWAAGPMATTLKIMSRRRISSFAVVVVALVLTGAAGARATDPQIAIDPVDQAWADSVVLHPADLGKGWRETPPTTQESESGTDEGVSFCPEGDPDQSDLVATGGSVSDFR